MLWFWLALVASLMWGLSYAISGHLSRTLSGEAIMLFAYIAGLPIYFLFCVKNNTLADVATMFRWPNLGWGALIVLSFVVGNLFILYAFKLTNNPFLVSSIEMTYPLFVLAFGMLFFRMGSITWLSAAGMVLIAAGLMCLYKVKVS